MSDERVSGEMDTSGEQQDKVPTVIDTGTAAPYQKPVTTEKARLTLAGTIYYQSNEIDNDTIHINLGTVACLKSDEQVFQRQIWINEQWTKLELGWIQFASMLVIVNKGLGNEITIPTEEEAKAQQEALLEIAILPPTVVELRTMHSPPKQEVKPITFCYLSNGEKLPIHQPQNLTQYRLRCKKGKTKVQIYLFPI